MTLLFQDLSQFFYKYISCRANQSVLNRQIINLINLLPIGMRILSTGFGANVVDGTSVVIIQEKTRQILQNFVLVFIHSQKFRFEVCRFHPKMFGNPFDVFFYVKRTCSFAAISTRKTVYFRKSLLVRFQSEIIQIFWRFLFESVKKFPVFFLLLLGLFFIEIEVHN